MWLSVVSLHEFAYGLARMRDIRRRTRIEAWLEAIKEAYADRILHVDERVAETAGRVRGACETVGRAITPLDSLIGATAFDSRPHVGDAEHARLRGAESRSCESMGRMILLKDFIERHFEADAKRRPALPRFRSAKRVHCHRETWSLSAGGKSALLPPGSSTQGSQRRLSSTPNHAPGAAISVLLRPGCAASDPHTVDDDNGAIVAPSRARPGRSPCSRRSDRTPCGRRPRRCSRGRD